MARLATEAYVDNIALPDYGPLAGRPTVLAAGDKALYFAVDDNGGTVYQVVSGAWEKWAAGVGSEAAITTLNSEVATLNSGVSTLNGEVATNTADIATNAAAVTTKAQALTPTAVKTANYTAASGEFVPVDCTAGNITVTLPTAPPDKTRIGVKLIAVTGIFAVTIARGGTDVFNKTGGSTTLSLSYANQSALLQYNASSGIWYVQSTDVPLAGLDTRYIAPTLVDVKGDLIVASADNTVVRKAAGANNKILIADSAQSDGLDWQKVSDMIKVGSTRDRVYPEDLGESLDRRRSSECSTMSRLFVSATAGNPVSGSIYSGLAYARTAQTFTQIRLATGTTTPAGITDFRLGVWLADGITKLTETANSNGIVTVGGTSYTLNLLASVVAAEGDKFYLGGGWIGTTPGVFRGIASLSSIVQLVPTLERSASGWTTGNALPNLSSSSSLYPWIELL